eukprot:scaffold160217_cov30-Tisochrysis_lutea.AAC.3
MAERHATALVCWLKAKAGRERGQTGPRATHTWEVMAPPYSSFHAHTRLMKASRPISTYAGRGQRPSST